MTAEQPAGGPLRALGPRLAVAFVAVAVAAVGLLAALTLLAARSEVSALVERQRDATVTAVAAALGQAYDEAGSWPDADLRPALTLAAAAPATVEIRTAAGRTVSPMGLVMTNMMARMHSGPLGPLGPPRRATITASGAAVGTVELRFPADALPRPEQQLRSGLGRTVGVGAAVAVLLAVVVAMVVTGRITRPLAALTGAVRTFERGDPSARASTSTEIGELDQLARAFNRMADTLARRERQRRAFAATIAHELRTPLTILQGSLEAMVDGVEPLTGERLGSLHDEVLRLRRLVEDLETLAAAEAAQLTLAREPLDLAEAARDAAASLQAQFAAADLQLRVSLERAAVHADPVRLRQVVTNLLTNAIKFTPAGGNVTVSVAPGSGVAELRVADTGPGVPEHEMPQLFERSWRGRAAAGVSGTGIGLAVAAELVNAHDGDLMVDSEPGHGATFTVRLPLVGDNGQR